MSKRAKKPDFEPIADGILGSSGMARGCCRACKREMSEAEFEASHRHTCANLHMQKVTEKKNHRS